MNTERLAEFYHGFVIDTPQGNNAFSFAARSNKKIFVPSLVKGTGADVQPGQEIVFSEMTPENGEVNATGLHRFVHIERPDQDIFIVDNHNHAFSCWSAGIQSGVILPGSVLVHVDQHKDTRVPEIPPTGDLCHYANYTLNVGNFIPPALDLGWFSRVVQVGTSDAFNVDLPDPFILDIDLDIFAPVMDHIPHNLKVSFLRNWIARARFITIATSPFFMDQARAVDIMKTKLFHY
ncbi:MAG: UPF0489 family protein [Candidatus Omnitrophota bacterium]